ncbi:MAG: NAD-dependent epimerase/dehydratase family protein [Acidimicrobiales bacterium]
MNRTCMVTGAAGFIGSRLVERLLDEGWRVVGVDAVTDSYDPVEKLARVDALRRRPGYRHVAVDLVEASLDEHLGDVEIVFHLAGRAGVRDSFSLAAKYQHDNVEATSHLLSASRRAGSVRRLVYASSSSVYGDAALPFREDGPTIPVSPYGQTKLEAERLCLESSGEDLETVALRYFTVYGPGQRPDMGLRLFAEAALAGRTIHLYGDGSQSRDFTFVDDVVEATRLAADAPVAGLAVNVGGGSRITLTEVFELLGELTGTAPQVEREPFARGDARHTGADLSRAKHLLGFRAQVDFAEGYAAEVAWLRTRSLGERRTA